MRAIVSGLILASVTVLASQAVAQSYSETVKKACRSDYTRFCKQHKLEDPKLRRCMDAAGQQLSQGCVQALVTEGEVTRERATQRWKHKLAE